MDRLNQGQTHQAMAQNGQANSTSGMSAEMAMQHSQILPNQVPAHLMGLMSNQAQIFPPAAMLANPSGYLAMTQATNSTQHGVNTQHNLGMPMNASMMQANQSNIAPYPHNSGLNMPMAPTSCNLLSTKADVMADTRRNEASSVDRTKQNRDRNREHARSTRLRKKAYVQKLKELVEGLHAERTEEVRQRRVAIQHLSEMQNVRRAVVRNFLRFHSNFEEDDRKWRTILEENFCLKQPVTPYRSFRRAEIEQECRMSRGVEAIMNDAASTSVMIEGIGMRSSHWMQIKREEFLQLEETKRGPKKMPECIVRQNSRLQHAVSSLSASSSSSFNTESNGDDPSKHESRKRGLGGNGSNKAAPDAKKASSPSSGSSQERLHDYHAKPLPDPKLGDSDRNAPSAEDSSSTSGNSNGNVKHVSTDASSGDDSAAAIATPPPTKRHKGDDSAQHLAGSAFSQGSSSLPPNIAKSGGIPHNIRPISSVGGGSDSSMNGAARLSRAPAIVLPPFAGIGKSKAATIPPSTTGLQGPVLSDSMNTSANGETPAKPEAAAPAPSEPPQNATSRAGESATMSQASAPNVIVADGDSSSNSSNRTPQTRGHYHINEDDMILMDDIIMCPFIFRSQDAVLRGALAECVMPGMLRAHFSSRNKLVSVEMVYDAMGFMQQLERASGNEGRAQIVPGNLEMALAPNATEARVITMADPPFLIVNVNEVWTRTTGYTQMEVEGKEYRSLLEGEGTVPEAHSRVGKPPHSLEAVAKGQCACSTNIHYDKEGRDFVEFVCSYPLSNGDDEITHLLHVSKELPSLKDPSLDNETIN